MTQEDKELLLKDLSARLSYGVMVQVNDDGYVMVCRMDEQTLGFIEAWDIKPYLRPMSSMTKAEEEEFNNLPIYHSEYLKVDFYNKYHLDFRGLIEMELALPAPEGMYC